MNEFFTWEILATYGGACLATGILTQFFKGYIKKLPTQALAYIIAVMLLFGAYFFTGALSYDSAAMLPFNAVLVATATSGIYDAGKRIRGDNKEGE